MLPKCYQSVSKIHRGFYQHLTNFPKDAAPFAEVGETLYPMMGTHLPRDGNAFYRKMGPPLGKPFYLGMATPSPRDGNPLSEGRSPLLRRMGTAFPKDVSPFFRGVETPLPRDGNPVSKRWNPIYGGTATPLPRDGNTFTQGCEPMDGDSVSGGRGPPSPRDGNRVSDGWNPLPEGWQPLYRGLWTHFPSDGDQGMGTPLPKDGNSVPEGWGPFCLWMARAEYAHFQRERSHMLSWVLGGQNASPTPVNAWRKTFSTGSRPPTWRETLGSIYPVTP